MSDDIKAPPGMKRITRGIPWSVWLVAALLVSMGIPGVGYRVAYLVILFTFLATSVLPNFVLHGLSAEPTVSFIVVTHERVSGFAYIWLRTGWTGVLWLVVVAALGGAVWIRRRSGRSVAGAINMLVLALSWPLCFELAMRTPAMSD